jgi:hypothetical protein
MTSAHIILIFKRFVYANLIMHCFQLHKLYNKSNYIEVYLLYEEFEYTKRGKQIPQVEEG